MPPTLLTIESHRIWNKTIESCLHWWLHRIDRGTGTKEISSQRNKSNLQHRTLQMRSEGANCTAEHHEGLCEMVWVHTWKRSSTNPPTVNIINSIYCWQVKKSNRGLILKMEAVSSRMGALTAEKQWACQLDWLVRIGWWNHGHLLRGWWGLEVSHPYQPWRKHVAAITRETSILNILVMWYAESFPAILHLKKQRL